MGCFYRNKTRVIHTHLTKHSEQMTELIIRVPDDMAQMIEFWVERIPEMEIVSCQDSTEYGLDEMNRRMACALSTLLANGAIRFNYDYTWIMVAINDGAINGLGGFRSPQSCMDYLKELGVEHVPSRTTLSTYFNKVIGSYPNWEFIDTQDPQEILRRKNIINQLISALNKAKIKEPEQKAEQ